MNKNNQQHLAILVVVGAWAVVCTMILIGLALSDQGVRNPKITKSWCEGSTKVVTFNNGQAAVTFNPYDCPATTLPGNYGG